MRGIKFISFPIFLFLFNCSLDAQSIDTLSAKRVIDKGSNGDIIIGEKNKKDQLKNPPVLLHQTDSVCREDVLRSSKKLPRHSRNH